VGLKIRYALSALLVNRANTGRQDALVLKIQFALSAQNAFLDITRPAAAAGLKTHYAPLVLTLPLRVKKQVIVLLIPLKYRIMIMFNF